MPITASKLRENVYRLLDEVLRTGKPLEIERNGHILRIVPEEKVSKIGRLKKKPCMKGDPEDFVHVDWSGEWKP